MNENPQSMNDLPQDIDGLYELRRELMYKAQRTPEEENTLALVNVRIGDLNNTGGRPGERPMGINRRTNRVDRAFGLEGPQWNKPRWR
jgi:hypothetical protein